MQPTAMLGLGEKHCDEGGGHGPRRPLPLFPVTLAFSLAQKGRMETDYGIRHLENAKAVGLVFSASGLSR